VEGNGQFQPCIPRGKFYIRCSCTVRISALPSYSIKCWCSAPSVTSMRATRNGLPVHTIIKISICNKILSRAHHLNIVYLQAYHRTQPYFFYLMITLLDIEKAWDFAQSCFPLQPIRATFLGVFLFGNCCASDQTTAVGSRADEFGRMDSSVLLVLHD
jgi:hypothetical protein